MTDYLKVRQSTKELRLRKQELIEKLKRPCEKCGESRLYVIDYHHVDPKEKLFDISKKHEHGIVKLRSELLKCICLCRNCHAEFHYLYGKDATKEDLVNYLNKTR